MTPPEMYGEVGSGLRWMMTAGLLGGGYVLVLLCWGIADLAASLTHCDTTFALGIFRIFINADCVVHRGGDIGSVTKLCAQVQQVSS